MLTKHLFDEKRKLFVYLLFTVAKMVINMGMDKQNMAGDII
jgi:hypothetical protein